jgi:hypothetical protein
MIKQYLQLTFLLALNTGAISPIQEALDETLSFNRTYLGKNYEDISLKDLTDITSDDRAFIFHTNKGTSHLPLLSIYNPYVLKTAINEANSIEEKERVFLKHLRENNLTRRKDLNEKIKTLQKIILDKLAIYIPLLRLDPNIVDEVAKLERVHNIERSKESKEMIIFTLDDGEKITLPLGYSINKSYKGIALLNFKEDNLIKKIQSLDIISAISAQDRRMLDGMINKDTFKKLLSNLETSQTSFMTRDLFYKLMDIMYDVGEGRSFSDYIEELLVIMPDNPKNPSFHTMQFSALPTLNNNSIGAFAQPLPWENLRYFLSIKEGSLESILLSMYAGEFEEKLLAQGKKFDDFEDVINASLEFYVENGVKYETIAFLKKALANREKDPAAFNSKIQNMIRSIQSNRGK